jgi:hypothetical protein
VKGPALLLAVFALTACQNAAASRNAEARALAKQVYGYLKSPCGLTLKPELLKQYDPIKARMKTLENSSIKDDLGLALEDVDYELSTTALECVGPDQPNVAETIRKDVADLDKSVTRLEEIAGIRKEQAK